MTIRFFVLVAFGVGVLAIPLASGAAQNDSGPIALAYVWHDTVTLANAEGEPVERPGPTFRYGQGARLFWTADAAMLYVARDDGLYTTGARGGAAVQVPGFFGRTLAISQDGERLYYMESVSPQPLDNPERVSFPIRELDFTLLEGGTGRLAGYFGRYAKNAQLVDLTFAAALYARDGGLLGPGRPNLWPTYGTNLFGTCCFPDPGLGLFNLGTGDQILSYDETFLPGAAAANLTHTHLAGPTTDGTIRVIDLITGGTRDYAIEIAGGIGTVERVAWSPDDTLLYILSRYDPDTTLELTVSPPFTVDTRSANVVLYRLNLVTGLVFDLAWRADVYGVSSLAATDRYVFAVVVDPNTALVNAINNGYIPAGTVSTDPALAQYMPQTHLWRVAVDGSSATDLQTDVWGLAARPIR
jgi:hypothetical protein